MIEVRVVSQVPLPGIEYVVWLIKEWGTRLGLHDWEIQVYVSSSGGNFLAETTMSDNYAEAQLAFAPWTLGLTPRPSAESQFEDDIFLNGERFERLVIHELLHIVFKSMDQVRRNLYKHLPEGMDVLFMDLQGDAEEEIVERLARILSVCAPRRDYWTGDRPDPDHEMLSGRQ